jgi:hypothetical protein
MDLSELNSARSQTPDTARTEVAVPERDMAWGLASQIGIEVAAPLTVALDRVRELQATGRIDRPGLHALHEELQQARRASMVGQQITRLARGGIQQEHETLNLTQALRDVLTQREQDLAARGLAVKEVLQPAEVVVDASLLFALIHALFDWSLGHARTPVEIRLDMKPWPVKARIVCRFGHVPADQVTADRNTARQPAAPSRTEALDCLSWRLLEHLAYTMQLPLERVDTSGNTSMTIEFPHTANVSLEGASAVEVDNAIASSGTTRPLSGSHILVIAAGRDVCNQVRHAVSQMGLPLDFVTTVDAAREFCQQRLPHAIIYESQAHDRNFDQLRSDIQQQASGLAWIEITEHGEAFEVSSFGGSSMARVGRDAITTSLPSALMFELAKGG